MSECGVNFYVVCCNVFVCSLCPSGNSVESFGLSMTDLEGDFDPDSYDGAMQKVFSEDYYEYEQEEVEEKPQFSDLEGPPEF